jgi:hypothetical protein
VNDAKIAGCVGYQQLCDGVLAHGSQCIYREGVGRNGLGVKAEDIFGAHSMEVGLFVGMKHATQVTIGDDALKLPI